MIWYHKAKYISSLSTLVLGSLMTVPHGVGFRFPIGHIDIPRAVCLMLVCYWFVGVLCKLLREKKLVLLPGGVSACLFCVLLLTSAVFSSGVSASLILAVQMCILWCIFTYAYVELFLNDGNHERMMINLIFIFSLLFIAVSYEVVLQKYIVPHKFRTSFYGFDEYKNIMFRTLQRDGTILAQGPFMWNHTLSGFCAAAAGVVVFAIDRLKKLGILFAFCFVAVLIASGTRSGFYGVAVAILLFSVFHRRARYVLHLGLSVILIEVFYQCYVGSSAPIFYASDLTANFPGNGLSNNAVRSQAFEIAAFCPSYLSCVDAVFAIDRLGSVGIKILGFLINLSQLEDWWLFGYGFGAFQRPEQVLSSALLYDDPGLIQLIFLESGLLAGLLFLYLIFRSIWISQKHDCLKCYGVGIFAWAMFGLSSWDVWGLILVMIFVFIIFGYNNKCTTLQVTEGKLHNLH